MKISLTGIDPYLTKDGSLIQEIIHPSTGKDTRMSLAEATVEKGRTTFSHLHRASQEIYHILSGRGTMSLGEETFDVGVGDSILIMPGIPHHVENTGDVPLRILCCCYPPYDHEDTELL
jgi:mannose-6-phosphate isomerase-like protein (cupin superfamily)